MRKKISLLITFTLILTLLAACSPSKAAVKDRDGNGVILPSNINKIISTAPSNTEILTDLGLGDKIIAADIYSKDIEGVNQNITFIDFFNPDAETILKLQPDIIIASGHNKSGTEDPYSLIKEAGISVVYIPSSDSIQGICDDISFIADITGTSKKGKEIIEDLNKEIAKYEEIGSKITKKKKVYFEISPAPSLFTFGKGTFLQELLEIIGADNVFANEGTWIPVSGEAVLKANPEVILTNVNYIDNPIEELKNREGWDAITAVSSNQVFSIDTNSSSRPSHKIIKALKEIAHAIYPDLYE